MRLGAHLTDSLAVRARYGLLDGALALQQTLALLRDPQLALRNSQGRLAPPLPASTQPLHLECTLEAELGTEQKLPAAPGS